MAEAEHSTCSFFRAPTPPLASSDTADVHPEFPAAVSSPVSSLTPSYPHLNCHPDSVVALTAELFLSAGQHLTMGVYSCQPNVMHKGLTVVEWHLIAVLGVLSLPTARV